MASLEDQLAELHQQKKQILKKIDKRNKNRKIKCEGCEGSHEIGDLTAIQSYWYTPPRGCTEGDYWNQGELRFICPETSIINRLLFDNIDVPWEERENYDNNPGEQFKRNYKHLFQKIEDSYDDTTLDLQRMLAGDKQKYANNFYVDKNRKKFGLVEKRK